MKKLFNEYSLKFKDYLIYRRCLKVVKKVVLSDNYNDINVYVDFSTSTPPHILDKIEQVIKTLSKDKVINVFAFNETLNYVGTYICGTQTKTNMFSGIKTGFGSCLNNVIKHSDSFNDHNGLTVVFSDSYFIEKSEDIPVFKHDAVLFQFYNDSVTDFNSVFDHVEHASCFELQPYGENLWRRLLLSDY